MFARSRSRFLFCLPLIPLGFFAPSFFASNDATTTDADSVQQVTIAEEEDADGLAALVAGTFTLEPPVLSCLDSEAGKNTITIQVSGGATYGAPFGFSVQWMTLADFTANNGWLDSGDARLCKASFSGHPACSIYDLNALGGGPLNNGCINDNEYTTVDINLGETYDNVCGASAENCGPDQLACGTTYVIRAFAHAGNCPPPITNGRPEKYKKSAFTDTLMCSTLTCFAGCTYTQGYWKTHGPVGCAQGNNNNEWPVDTLTIGGIVYTDAQLCANLNTKPQGNAVIILSHQLIAALLNVANGATPPPAQPGYPCTLEQASALLNGLDINTAFVPADEPAGDAMGFATRCLDAYNNGKLSIPHCP